MPGVHILSEVAVELLVRPMEGLVVMVQPVADMVAVTAVVDMQMLQARVGLEAQVALLPLVAAAEEAVRQQEEQEA